MRTIKRYLLRSRYIKEMIDENARIKSKSIRLICDVGGVLKLLVSHKFNLFDYENELNLIKENGYIIDLEKGDVQLYIPRYEYDELQHEIAVRHDFYERKELDYLQKKYNITSNTVVLDIGANIGNHTVFFAKVCRCKKVFAFEPIPEIFDILKRNVKGNEIEDKVELNNVALGEQSGNATISFQTEKNCGATHIQSNSEGNLLMARLDDYDFENIDFIKIDVEEYEYNLFLGAEETLKKHSPVIYVEIMKPHYQKVNSVLEGYGYRMAEAVTNMNYVYLKE